MKKSTEEKLADWKLLLEERETKLKIKHVLTLAAGQSTKSDALKTIVYPALQVRSQRCDLESGQTSDWFLIAR